MRHKVYIIFGASVLLSSCGGARESTKALAHTYLKQSCVESETDNYKKALQWANKAVQTHPTPHAYAMKALLLYQIGDYDGSITLFEQITRDKNTPATVRTEARNNIATILHHTGKADKAQAIWRALLDDQNYVTPEVALYNLGLLALERKNLKKAEILLEQSVEQAPDYVDALYYLARVHTQQKQFGKAEKRLNTLLMFAPGHTAAQQLQDQVAKKIKPAF